jgi:hypothetical protein
MQIAISAIQARQQLGELLEKVYYQNLQFLIARKNKPMARLVAEPFMRAVDKLLAEDQSLADTLALMLNDEAQVIIHQSRKEYQAGQKILLEEALQ